MKMTYTTKKVPSETEMRLRNLIWYLPSYVFSYLYNKHKNFQSDELEKKTEYQKAREMRIGSILALCFYHWHDIPHYVAIPDSDPPDLYIAGIETTKDKKPIQIMSVEVTTYLTLEKSLKQQLVESGKTPKHHLFDENTIILVNVGVGIDPDYIELQLYLAQINAPYEVWCLQDVDKEGTTYAHFTRIASEGVASDEICIVPTLEKLEARKEMDRIKFRKSGESRAGIVEEAHDIPNQEPWNFTSFNK